MPIPPEHITANQDALLAIVNTFPSDGEYRLYDEDPTETGAELSSTGGYEPISAATVSWAAAPDGEPAAVAEGAYTATGAWAEVPSWWGFHDADGALRAYGPLEGTDDERTVTVAGPVPLTLKGYFDTTDEVLD